MSRETLANDIWRACDIMRRDDGTTGIMEYMEQLSWLLFLKVFESIEDDYENKALLFNPDYVRVISGPYRWSVWTGSARKRAEAKVAVARQTVSKAKGQLERSKQRLADLKAGRDPDAPKNKKANSFQPTPTQLIEAEQAIAEAETTLSEAEANLQAAEVNLAKTIETLRQRVKVLYDEEAVQQQVLAVIDRQFGGRLDLMGEQLDVLRQAEEQRGRALAETLVEGLTGEAMLDFVDSQLFPHLRRLRGTPEKNIIGSIFSEIPGNRMRSSHNLKDVIDLIDEIDFHDQVDTQVVSQIYEDLLARLGTEGGIAGEFYTPRRIIRFMVQVINPEIGETVYDPFCGSAGFLVEAHKHMQQHVNTPEEHDTLQGQTFYGQEKKPLPALLGMMNMILHGVSTPNISRVNTLEKEDVRNIPHEARFDVILTNPPFGGKEGSQIQGNFKVKSNATELLALQYIIAKLRPHGRCGVVVPEGILFRSDAFAKVKEELLQKFNLYAIISLPAGVFANVTSTGAGPKTDILFFEGPGPTHQIWYYEVEQVGFTLTKAQRPLKEDDLPTALTMLEKYRQAQMANQEPPLNDRCWVVSLDDIKARDYDLTGRNPHQRDEDYSHRAPEVLLADIAAKHERVGEILAELQEWLEDEDVLGELIQ